MMVNGVIEIMRLGYCGGVERQQWLGDEPKVGGGKIDTSKTIEALVVMLVRFKIINDRLKGYSRNAMGVIMLKDC